MEHHQGIREVVYEVCEAGMTDRVLIHSRIATGALQAIERGQGDTGGVRMQVLFPPQ